MSIQTHYTTVSSGGLAQLVARAQEGEVIRVGPGTYDDDLVIDKQLAIVGDDWSVVNFTGTVTYTASTLFKGIKFGSSAATQQFQASTSQLRMDTCNVHCQTFPFPVNNSFFDRCVFQPTLTGGWTVDGNGAYAHMNECRFGFDIPITAGTGITISDAGRLIMRGGEMNTATGTATDPAFSVTDNNSKLFLQGVRVVSDLGYPIVLSTGAPTVVARHCHIEGNHATQATVQMLNASTAQFDHCTIASKVANNSYTVNSTGATEFQNCILEGRATITAGTVYWRGANTVIAAAAGAALVDAGHNSVGYPMTYLSTGAAAGGGLWT